MIGFDKGRTLIQEDAKSRSQQWVILRYIKRFHVSSHLQHRVTSFGNVGLFVTEESNRVNQSKYLWRLNQTELQLYNDTLVCYFGNKWRMPFCETLIFRYYNLLKIVQSQQQ